jgi:hypothetical protein
MPKTRGERIVATLAVLAILVLVVFGGFTYVTRDDPPQVVRAPPRTTTQSVTVPRETVRPLVWSGDFEPGNLSQWDDSESAANRISVVRDPVRQGHFAGRFEVDSGDYVNAGQRAELVHESNELEGEEAWWGWAVYFPQEFKPGEWTIFAQWHDRPAAKFPPPIAFEVRNNNLRLVTHGGVREHSVPGDWILAPFQREHWYDIAFHVHWSSQTGFVEVWVDGDKVVPKTSTPTLYAGLDLYLKQGNYRAVSDERSVLYVDGMRKGFTRKVVSSR